MRENWRSRNRATLTEHPAWLALDAHYKAVRRRTLPELETANEPQPGHDSSTNALIRRYRRLKGALRRTMIGTADLDRLCKHVWHLRGDRIRWRCRGRRAMFAARPSGTEDIHKVYTESFRGAPHARSIVGGHRRSSARPSPQWDSDEQSRARSEPGL